MNSKASASVVVLVLIVAIVGLVALDGPVSQEGYVIGEVVQEDCAKDDRLCKNLRGDERRACKDLVKLNYNACQWGFLLPEPLPQKRLTEDQCEQRAEQKEQSCEGLSGDEQQDCEHMANFLKDACSYGFVLPDTLQQVFLTEEDEEECEQRAEFEKESCERLSPHFEQETCENRAELHIKACDYGFVLESLQPLLNRDECRSQFREERDVCRRLSGDEKDTCEHEAQLYRDACRLGYDLDAAPRPLPPPPEKIIVEEPPSPPTPPPPQPPTPVREVPAVTPPPVPAPAIPEGLVSRWLADGNTQDSANKNPGTLVGGSYAKGLVGQAFSLDGVNDYVNVPDSDSLELSQWTLQAWIRPDDVNNDRQIISKFGRQGSWAYQIGLAHGGVLRSDISGDGERYEAIISPVNLIALGEWTHVATTFDNGNLKLYVNGREVVSQRFGYVYRFTGGATSLSIGRDPSGSQYFDGLIDEAEIYNKALSPTEIRFIHATAPPPPEPLPPPTPVREVPAVTPTPTPPPVISDGMLLSLTDCLNRCELKDEEACTCRRTSDRSFFRVTFAGTACTSDANCPGPVCQGAYSSSHVCRSTGINVKMCQSAIKLCVNGCDPRTGKCLKTAIQPIALAPPDDKLAAPSPYCDKYKQKAPGLNIYRDFIDCANACPVGGTCGPPLERATSKCWPCSQAKPSQLVLPYTQELIIKGDSRDTLIDSPCEEIYLRFPTTPLFVTEPNCEAACPKTTHKCYGSFAENNLCWWCTKRLPLVVGLDEPPKIEYPTDIVPVIHFTLPPEFETGELLQPPPLAGESPVTGPPTLQPLGQAPADEDRSCHNFRSYWYDTYQECIPECQGGLCDSVFSPGLDKYCTYCTLPPNTCKDVELYDYYRDCILDCKGIGVCKPKGITSNKDKPLACWDCEITPVLGLPPSEIVERYAGTPTEEPTTQQRQALESPETQTGLPQQQLVLERQTGYTGPAITGSVVSYYRYCNSRGAFSRASDKLKRLLGFRTLCYY